MECEWEVAGPEPHVRIHVAGVLQSSIDSLNCDTLPNPVICGIVLHVNFNTQTHPRVQPVTGHSGNRKSRCRINYLTFLRALSVWTCLFPGRISGIYQVLRESALLLFQTTVFQEFLHSSNRRTFFLYLFFFPSSFLVVLTCGLKEMLLYIYNVN